MKDVKFEACGAGDKVGEIFPGQRGQQRRGCHRIFFSSCFNQINFSLDMVQWTNCQLNKLKLLETTCSEVLKFLVDLLSQLHLLKDQELVPLLGLTAMSKHCLIDMY